MVIRVQLGNSYYPDVVYLTLIECLPKDDVINDKTLIPCWLGACKLMNSIIFEPSTHDCYRDLLAELYYNLYPLLFITFSQYCSTIESSNFQPVCAFKSLSNIISFCSLMFSSGFVSFAWKMIFFPYWHRHTVTTIWLLFSLSASRDCFGLMIWCSFYIYF